MTMNSNQNDEKMTAAEVIEATVGDCKRWQISVFLLVFLVNVPLSLQELSITLLAPPVHFTCSHPSYNACEEGCPSIEWDRSVFNQTISMEWYLICDRAWLENFAQTILMCGILVGNFGFGIIADRFGRRNPLVIAIVLEIITGISISFVTSFWMFMVLRFLVAVAAGGTLCTAFVIVVEIIGQKYRSTFGILFQTSYYVGHSLLGLIGYYIRDWRYIQLTISLPVILLVSYYWLLPESPRWLLTVGKLDEAIHVLEKAAQFNKMPTENIRQIVIEQMVDISATKENIFDLFKKHNVRRKTIFICLNWACVGLCFFGVAQYMGHIGGNMFINISSAGLVQIPGNIIIIFIIQKWGRKITLIITYLLAAITSLLLTVVPTEPTWIDSLLGTIAMMGISLSFATIFVWSGELYATSVRNVGMGTSAMCAKIGSMIAPFVTYSNKFYHWIPPLIYGLGALIGIVASLNLPETLNKKMPDSVLEAEHIGTKDDH